MKNTWKKVLFSLGVIGFIGAGSIGLVNATGGTNSFGDPSGGRDQGADGAAGLGVVGADSTSAKTNYQTNNLVPTIKKFINWVLGMLSLIALVICLRGGFQMLTAAGDEGKYKKGFTILKQAAIALAVIGLSWLFVTLILYLINNASSS